MIKRLRHWQRPTEQHGGRRDLRFTWWRLSLTAVWVLAGLAVAWWGYQAYFGYVFEDSYITFRYAQNLAAGHGFTFNPGDRVFGTTTPLWTMVLALGAFFGADIVSVANTVGWLCLVATGLIGALIIDRTGQPLLGALFVLLVWGGLGRTFTLVTLETPLLLLLSMVAVMAAQCRAPRTVGIALGLSMLVRYDAVILAAGLLLGVWIRDRVIPWKAGLIAAGIVIPWLAFAGIYFGSPVPNTLGAKTGAVDLGTYVFESGWRLARDTAWPLVHVNIHSGRDAGYLMLGAVLAIGCVGLIKAKPRRDLAIPLVLFLTPWVWWLGYAMIGPPPAHRWYLLPPLFVLLLSSLWLLSASLARPQSTSHWLWVFAAMPLAPFLWQFHSTVFNQAEKAQSSDFYRGRIDGYEHIADWLLAQNLDRSTTSLLVREPGYLAYRTGVRMVDGAGLVTPDIYFHNRARKTRLRDLIERHQPDFVVLSSRQGVPREPAGYVALLQAGDRVLFGSEERVSDHNWSFTRVPRDSAFKLAPVLQHPVRFDQLDKVQIPSSGITSPAVLFGFDAIWAPWAEAPLRSGELVVLTQDRQILSAGSLKNVATGIDGYNQGSLLLVRPWDRGAGHLRLSSVRSVPHYVASAMFVNPTIVDAAQLTGHEPVNASCVQISSTMGVPYRAFAEFYSAAACRPDRRQGELTVGARFLAMLVRGRGQIRLKAGGVEQRSVRARDDNASTIVWDVSELRGQRAQLEIRSHTLIEVAEIVFFDDLSIPAPQPIATPADQ